MSLQKIVTSVQKMRQIFAIFCSFDDIFNVDTLELSPRYFLSALRGPPPSFPPSHSLLLPSPNLSPLSICEQNLLFTNLPFTPLP